MKTRSRLQAWYCGHVLIIKLYKNIKEEIRRMKKLINQVKTGLKLVLCVTIFMSSMQVFAADGGSDH